MRRAFDEINTYPSSREPDGNHGKVSVPAGVNVFTQSIDGGKT
jgi:hypothetical protein